MTATKKPKAQKSAKVARPIDDRLGKVQTDSLKLLAKKGPLTRADISKAMGGTFIGGTIMGHVNPEKVEPRSLLARGYVTISAEGDGAARYKITAAGRKALAANGKAGA